MSKAISHSRRRFFGTATMTIAATWLGVTGCAGQQKMPVAGQRAVEGELRSLGGATEWLNSQPLTAAGLRGNVVLINFGTYTCINWLRSLPYVRAWAEKYKQHGLVVITI